MIGVPVVAAPSDGEAEFLASSVYQRVLGILRGDRRCLPPPRENCLAGLAPNELAGLDGFLGAAVIGSPESVRAGLLALQQATGADEMMLVCDVFDPALRLRSLEITANCFTN